VNEVVSLVLVPITFKEACKFTGYNHRHNQPPVGHKFSIGLESNGKRVGVVMAGRPVARHLDDGQTIEILRVTTDGTKNACSKLYGAATRAAFAMGYLRAITYTLQSETGASLRGAGFTPEAELSSNIKAWKSRWGIRQSRLDGRDVLPSEDKIRWVRYG